jgi:hypothetical protein
VILTTTTIIRSCGVRKVKIGCLSTQKTLTEVIDYRTDLAFLPHF